MWVTPNWLEWYQLRHQRECLKSGTPFEDYVSSILRCFHDDFTNPSPAGSLGDGGCDGLADAGRTLYACYGQRPGRSSAERETQRKLVADFERGRDYWDSFTIWRFVTNAPIGPKTLKSFTALQQQHLPGTERPLTLRIWDPDVLWTDVIRGLPQEVLDFLFPGAPGIENVELEDLLPLLDVLGQSGDRPEEGGTVRPVPGSKMDFNNLSTGSRMELNSGRVMAPRIDKWYDDNANPGLYDAHGERFTEIYRASRQCTDEPSEILERIYVAVAGPNFRMDAKRANAAYAVLAYFFDSCHIFEMPPAELDTQDVAAN